jgi:hypothetical protein
MEFSKGFSRFMSKATSEQRSAYNKALQVINSREITFYPKRLEIANYHGDYYLSLCGEGNIGISEFICKA